MRDGKELFFLEIGIPRNRLMATPVRSDARGEFRAGTPQPLFEFTALSTIAQASVFLYSPSPDGQRFLVTTSRNSDAQPTLNVISNWEQEALGMKP